MILSTIRFPVLLKVSGDLVRMITRGPAGQTQRLIQVMSKSQDRGWRTLKIGFRESNGGGAPDGPRPRSCVARANRDVPARHGKQG